MNDDDDFQPPLTRAQITQFFATITRTRRREDDAQEENQRGIIQLAQRRRRVNAPINLNPNAEVIATHGILKFKIDQHCYWI